MFERLFKKKHDLSELNADIVNFIVPKLHEFLIKTDAIPSAFYDKNVNVIFPSVEDDDKAMGRWRKAISDMIYFFENGSECPRGQRGGKLFVKHFDDLWY